MKDDEGGWRMVKDDTPSPLLARKGKPLPLNRDKKDWDGGKGGGVGRCVLADL